MKWAIICGRIRKDINLLKTLNFAQKLKNQNLIDNIILSTWENDINQYPSILNFIKDNQIILLENKRLVSESSVNIFNNNGNYMRQYELIYSALSLCPANSFILKLRTDKCDNEYYLHEEDVINLLQINTNKLYNNFYDLDYKIVIANNPTWASNHVPCIFFWYDRFYYGYREDLLKIVNFNFLHTHLNGMIAEQCLWVPYFLKFYPNLIYFFKACNQKKILDAMWFTDIFKHNKIINILKPFASEQKLFYYAFLIEREILNKSFFNFMEKETFDIQDLPPYLETRTNIDFKNYFQNKELVKYEISLIQDFLLENFKIPKLEYFSHQKLKYGHEDAYFFHHGLGHY